MEIIVGREAGANNPRLCLTVGSSKRFIDDVSVVPKSVSRTHCRIDVGDDGTISITNISGHNTLFVNGLEYKSKTISDADQVELGADRYKLNIKAVISAVKGSAASGTCNISALKAVWTRYDQSKLGIQTRERKINAFSAIPGVISMISIALSFIDGCRIAFITMAAVFALTFALIRIKSAGKVPLELKKIDELFQDEYVCPNCKHFLGNQPYKVVLRNGSCPFCRCKFKG